MGESDPSHNLEFKSTGINRDFRIFFQREVLPPNDKVSLLECENLRLPFFKSPGRPCLLYRISICGSITLQMGVKRLCYQRHTV